MSCESNKIKDHCGTALDNNNILILTFNSNFSFLVKVIKYV